jgi:hypothetical protein
MATGSASTERGRALIAPALGGSLARHLLRRGQTRQRVIYGQIAI